MGINGYPSPTQFNLNPRIMLIEESALSGNGQQIPRSDIRPSR